MVVVEGAIRGFLMLGEAIDSLQEIDVLLLVSYHEMTVSAPANSYRQAADPQVCSAYSGLREMARAGGGFGGGGGGDPGVPDAGRGD